MIDLDDEAIVVLRVINRDLKHLVDRIVVLKVLYYRGIVVGVVEQILVSDYISAVSMRDIITVYFHCHMVISVMHGDSHCQSSIIDVCRV